MEKSKKIFTRLLIGGIIGFCFVNILILPIYYEGRFILDALKVLGTAGFVGGAIAGGVFALNTSRSRLIFTVSLGSLFCCTLTGVGLFAYSILPWPSPKPYLNAQVSTETEPTGSWGMQQTKTYKTNVSIVEIQQHYNDEMRRYCVYSWKYETVNDQDSGDICKKTQCEIRRYKMDQEFRVEMCLGSDKEVKVEQIVLWED
ncbi:MAG: hypothetical protein AAF639_15730 [Chloroflexota bacterium]